jgi:signal transduction histidine kinase/ActR/RegA family two-component response regulator
MHASMDALFNPDLWKPALEKFAEATNLTVQLFGAGEHVVFGPIHPTPIFQLFDEKGYDPDIFAECARQCLAQPSHPNGRPAVVVSKYYGLAVIGTSLVLNSEVVGAAVGGYAFVDFSQLSEIQRLALDADIEFERLWHVAREQKPVAQHRLILNGELLQVLGDALLRENYHTRQHEAAEEEVAKELADTQRLHTTSTLLIQGGNSDVLYEQILLAAMGIMRSDMASMQMLDADSGDLRLLASKGLTPEAAAFWEWVRLDSDSTCAAALRTGQRTVVPDLETCDSIVGTPDFDMYRHAGIRAVQSTPLLSRSGSLLGMLSTHWREPHEPEVHHLRLLDILARQTADLIERKASEQERERLLASEQQARQEAETANHAKDQFLAVVSHELRTPLTPILMWTHMLKPDSDPQQFSYAMEMIERNVKVQLRLIGDILDLNRTARNTMSLQLAEHELSSIVSAAVESMQEEAERKRITLIFAATGESLRMQADSVRLTQVFTNILVNALKFTLEGGAIRVNLAQEHGEAVVKFRDNGQGIAPEFLPHAFEMFRQQEDGTRRSHSGLGIGLALVKSLVELHGGEIAIASEGFGMGTEVTIRLPLLPSASETEIPKTLLASAQLSPALRGVSVLLVEDTADSLAATELLLKGLGAKVTSARDGREALEAMAFANPDLVLCDLAMPHMDGFEFIEKLYRTSGSMHPPVIALSGLTSDADHERTRAAGFAGHVNKPFDETSLLSAIAHGNSLRESRIGL